MPADLVVRIRHEIPWRPELAELLESAAKEIEALRRERKYAVEGLRDLEDLKDAVRTKLAEVIHDLA